MEKCCNTCGYLACNKDQPSPPGSTCEWYSQANLDRMWDECREHGEYLICHSSDPHAYFYGGPEGVVEGKERACLGFTFLVYMHLKIFEFESGYEPYVAAVGESLALSKEAIFSLVLGMSRGYTGMFGGARIPVELHESRPLVFPTGSERTVRRFDEIMTMLHTDS